MQLIVKRTTPTQPATEATPTPDPIPTSRTDEQAAEQGATTEAPEQRAPSTVQLRRSTLLAALAVTAAVTAGAMSMADRDTFSAESRDDAPSVLSVEREVPEPLSAPELIEQALAAAGDFYASYQTFAGFTYPNVATATAPDIVLVATVVDDTCAYSKIEGTQVFSVGVDTSGETCLPATMVQAQEVLDRYATATAAQTGVGLGHLVTAVQTAGAMYASMNYVEARPSFLGLTSLEVENTTVVWVSPDGSAADVRIDANGACRVVHLSALVGVDRGTSEC